jgi:hypothetical protein
MHGTGVLPVRREGGFYLSRGGGLFRKIGSGIITELVEAMLAAEIIGCAIVIIAAELTFLGG